VDLERRVRERTADLEAANQKLSVEIGERQRAESERVALLEREQAARAEAEAVNRMKDLFLATLSHELRTPLNAILGWSHMLERQRTDPALLERALAVIKSNAHVQAQLIDDILDVSRIISGKLSLEIRDVNLETVINAALDVVRPAAEAKGIQIETALDPVDAFIGDADRLQQVAWNLLSNAIKFTPMGGRVFVRLESNDVDVQIIVTDSGEGISAKFLPHVFDRFTQADSSTTRPHRGLGLGMAIVRHLVELHGGTVRAESAGENQGATFTVRLPFRRVPVEELCVQVRAVSVPDSPGVREGALPSLEGVSVLIVDDDAYAREVESMILQATGARVSTAASAAEALEALERLTPNVLVSDIGMPGEDGYALIRRVRALPPERGGRIPAIALTAYATAGDLAAALDAGYQHHISKPISPAVLIEAVAGILSRLASRPGDEAK
jgi:signal transduction histidine kinase/CheY-like chemotaxis protein